MVGRVLLFPCTPSLVDFAAEFWVMTGVEFGRLLAGATDLLVAAVLATVLLVSVEMKPSTDCSGTPSPTFPSNSSISKVSLEPATSVGKYLAYTASNSSHGALEIMHVFVYVHKWDKMV